MPQDASDTGSWERVVGGQDRSWLPPTGTVETERDDPKQLYPLADDIGLEAGPCSQPSLSSCATMRHQGGGRQRTDHLKEQLLIVCSPQLRRSFEEGWARGPCGMMGRCGEVSVEVSIVCVVEGAPYL